MCKEIPKKYIALKDISLYREPIDGTQEVSYIVKKDEVCYFGEEVIDKVFLFKEVVCANKHGWTPDWMDFKESK